MNRVNLRLIPECDGSFMDPSAVKWFEKAECVCRMFKVKEPVRLLKGAYAVYQQLVDEADLEEIKRALYATFGMNSFFTGKQSIE